jgi:hypothetical protein
MAVLASGALAFAAVLSCADAELNAILGPTTTQSASGTLPDVVAPGDDASDAGATDADFPETAPSGPTFKRGLAFGYNSITDLQNAGVDLRLVVPTTGIWWWQNWISRPDNTLGGATPATIFVKSGVEYVPTYSGLPTAVPSAKYMLTYSEVNNADQHFVSPTAVAGGWLAIQRYASMHNIKVVGPTVETCRTCTSASGNGSMDPTAWLDAFFSACPTCKPDYLGLSFHTCDPQELKSELAMYETNYALPHTTSGKVWITQFYCREMAEGGSPSPTDEESFVGAVVPTLEADSNVFRYGWFTGRSDPADGGFDPTTPDLLNGTIANPQPGTTTLGERYLSIIP